MFHVKQWRGGKAFGDLGLPAYEDQNVAISVARSYHRTYGFEGAEELVVETDGGEPVFRIFNRGYNR